VTAWDIRKLTKLRWGPLMKGVKKGKTARGGLPSAKTKNFKKPHWEFQGNTVHAAGEGGGEGGLQRGEKWAVRSAKRAARQRGEKPAGNRRFGKREKGRQPIFNPR